MRRALQHVGVFLVAGLVLLTPSVWAVYTSTTLHDWRDSPRSDGQRYVVSQREYVPQELDETGVAAVVATLQTWRGQPTDEATAYEELLAREFDYTLASFSSLATDMGLEGHWVEAGTAALAQLNVPFIAHLDDAGGRFIIVREVRQGYLYATDPAAGNVLYPIANFAEVWTGRALAFPEPPPLPEARQ